MSFHLFVLHYSMSAHGDCGWNHSVCDERGAVGAVSLAPSDLVLIQRIHRGAHTGPEARRAHGKHTRSHARTTPGGMRADTQRGCAKARERAHPWRPGTCFVIGAHQRIWNHEGWGKCLRADYAHQIFFSLFHFMVTSLCCIWSPTAHAVCYPPVWGLHIISACGNQYIAVIVSQNQHPHTITWTDLHPPSPHATLPAIGQRTKTPQRM